VKPNEKHAFADLLSGLLDIYGRSLTKASAGLWWGALERYSLDEVRAAFSRYTQDPEQGRYPPTPASVIACIPVSAGNARMSADEAWSLCLASFDESDTAITCEAIDAGRAAALPVFEMGDKIGARMAFKSAYDRAIASGQRQTWRLSVGWDRAKREQAAERAVTAGWISHDAVRDYLPAPAVTPEGAAIAGLLTGNVVPIRGVDETVRARLAEVRALLSQQDRPEMMPEDQERFETRKRKEIERLQAMQKRIGSDG
jgi:hypothetical protein